MVDQVVSTICKIVKYIYEWQDAYFDSQHALTTLKTTIRLVEDTVKRLSTIQHQSLETHLRAMMDYLNETKDILVANGKTKGKIKQFFFPKGVVETIQKIETRMHQLVSIMTFAITTTQLSSSQPVEKKQTALDFIIDAEARKFWDISFGEEVFSVKWDALEKALMAGYAKHLNVETLVDMRMCLDNLNTGHVSCHRLSDFCGDENLSTRLQAYTLKKRTPSKTPPSDGAQISLPLLLWIDDRPQNNQVEIEHAKKKGVHIVVLNTTSEAKQWIMNNDDILGETDPRRVRMITDNAREGAGTALDINAGEDMIRFLRGRRCTIPIMVYCGDLNYSKYTAKYDECTTTNMQATCLKFIDELKA